MLKSNISYVYFHKSTKIKNGSSDELPLKKITMLNVKILIKSVFNENYYRYYYKVILEKCPHKQYKQ